MFGRAYPHSPSSESVNNATPTAHTQITPRLPITSGTQMQDFSHRIPLREEGRLLRARDRGFESTFLQRRVRCELAPAFRRQSSFWTSTDAGRATGHGAKDRLSAECRARIVRPGG